jgi:hypothetical protein
MSTYSHVLSEAARSGRPEVAGTVLVSSGQAFRGTIAELAGGALKVIGADGLTTVIAEAHVAAITLDP